ncbi:MAG: hypothetical protein JWN13_3524 [Betaproteobacteria bacterium]|jgi:uncharacterized protein YecE (DUF72 family)|nr:hypothetical protein [Betaproteobacteria bacterium]
MPSSDDDSRAEWRARREERRAKQRAQNIIRAQKMHVSRLEYEKSHPAGAVVRAPSRARGTAQIKPQTFVGCSGWYYWHWRDSFYPEGLPSSRWFDHYASQFRTVELNAPFYSWPTLATINTWKRQAGRRRFTYAIKVNELITHTKRFVRTGILVKDFGLIADLLGPSFSCFLFQLPPSVHYTNATLKRILKQLDPRRRNVVEFRHRSWWNETVYKAFRESNTIFCSASGPRLPDELVKTADDVYIRFHGTKKWYRHDYTKDELAVWTERIRRSGAGRVWAYFNNDREGYAIKNARELTRQLKRSEQTRKS